MKFYNNKLAALLLFFISFSFTASVSAQKLTAEEIIAKHLDSIGTKENRAKIKNIGLIGSAQFSVLRAPVFTRGNSTLGKLVIFSEGDKIFMGARFNSQDYPLEELIYDGKNINTGFVQPGKHSMLGYFLINNRDIVGEGLFSGPLSTTWSLLNWESQKVKVKENGTKKIDGKQTYVVDYTLKGSSQLSIKLYFDSETFQLMRTEYTRTFPRPMVTDPTQSSFQVETVHKLTEEFSNYKQVKGISLPQAYKINLLSTGSTTNELEWNFTFTEFLFNEKLDPKTFETK